MSSDTPTADWKLKLRYGQLKTPFRHYTGMAEGVAGDLKSGFACRKGPAFMGMKMWAASADEATDMMRVIGRDIGFTVSGRVQIYETEPSQPPGDNASGYDIQFTPFDPKDMEDLTNR